MAQANVVDVPARHGVVRRRVAVAAHVVVLHDEAELHPLTHVIGQIDGDVCPPAGVVGAHGRATKGGLGRTNALAAALDLTLVVALGVQPVSKANVGGVGLVDRDVVERVWTAGVGREELVVALSNFDVRTVAVVLLNATRSGLEVVQGVEGGKAEGGPAHRGINENRRRQQTAVERVSVVVVTVIVVEGVGAPAHLTRLAAGWEDAERGGNAAVTPRHGAHGRLRAVGEVLRGALKIAEETVRRQANRRGI